MKKTILLSILGFVLLVLLGEALAFKLAEAYSSQLPDVVYNEVGMRGNKSVAELAADPRPKVLFLGNSVTLGLDVRKDELFTSILQERHKDYLIVNAGFDAANPIKLHNIYKKELATLNPDYIVYIPVVGEFFVYDYTLDALKKSKDQFPDRYNLRNSKKNKSFRSYIKEISKLVHLYVSKLYTSSSRDSIITSEDYSYTNNAQENIKEKYNDGLRNLLTGINKYNQSVKDMFFLILPTRHMLSIYDDKFKARCFDSLDKILMDTKVNRAHLSDGYDTDKAMDLFVDKVHFSREGHKLTADIIDDYLSENGVW